MVFTWWIVGLKDKEPDVIYLIIILTFYFLHLDFFVRFFCFDETEHDFLVGCQVYNYDSTIAQKACAFACLSFLALVLGLLTRHRRVRIWEGVDASRLTLIFRWTLGICTGINVWFVFLSQTTDYLEFNETVSEHSLLWQIKAIPLVAGCLMFGNGVRFQLIDKAMLVTFLGLSLLTLNRSTFLEVIAIVGVYYISRYDNAIKKRYFVALTLLLVCVNAIAIYRETREFSGSLIAEKGNTILLKNEYLFFLDALLSETMVQFESRRLGGETFLDAFKLLVPSVARKAVGIPDDAHPIFEQIGWATFPDYGGGFCFLAECYLNFGWAGAACMFLFGAILKRFYTLMDYARRNKLFCVYSVCPLVFLDLSLMYRNGAAAHIKYLIQICAIALVILFVCSKKSTVVNLVLSPTVK